MLAGGACALVAVAVAALLLSGAASGQARAASTADTLVMCNGVQVPVVGAIDFGTAMAGLPRTDFAKLCNSAAPGEPATVPFTSAIYGDCIATSEEGCGPPLEIQTWPECDRNLALYTVTGADGSQQPYPYAMSTLSQAPQVPVATFDNGTRTEIYTGSATIVIFAEDAAVMKQAVDAVSTMAAPGANQAASQLMSAAHGGASC